MIKRLFLLSTIITISTIAFSQSEKEKLFAITVKKIVEGFSKKDSTSITSLSNPKIGVYFLWHGNTYLNYMRWDTISFSGQGRFVNMLNESDNIHYTDLQYAPLPKLLCDSEMWSKKGLFVDTTKIDHMLSDGCKFKNKYEPSSYMQKTIDFFWKLELTSRRVILQDDQHKEIVFYLSYINKKWYLTMIDKASSDCSS